MAAAALATVGFGLSAAGCEHFPRTRADLVRNPTPCVDAHVTVYFNEGSNRLTRPAAQVIEETGRNLRNCSILQAHVVGLADATGTPEANLSLSQRRAVAVADALRRQGLPAPSFDIAAAGEAGAMTDDGRDDPVRRRAEIFLEVAPK
jgi:outer membrane protein OmpA-like peptidoglycan-associated protein